MAEETTQLDLLSLIQESEWPSQDEYPLNRNGGKFKVETLIRGKFEASNEFLILRWITRSR